MVSFKQCIVWRRVLHIRRESLRWLRVHCNRSTGTQTDCHCSVVVLQRPVATAEVVDVDVATVDEDALVADEGVRVAGEDAQVAGEGVLVADEDVRVVVDEDVPTVDGDVHGNHAQALGFATSLSNAKNVQKCQVERSNILFLINTSDNQPRDLVLDYSWRVVDD